MVKIDFADLAGDSFKHAAELFQHKGIFEYNESNRTLTRSTTAELATELIVRDPIRAIDFWNNFSLGIEILAKAVLIKNQVPIFKKIDLAAKKRNVTRSSVRAAYEGYFEKIVAPGNHWLKRELERLNISNIGELGTPTLGELARSFVPMLVPSKISTDESKEICEGLSALADLRRNRDTHFFFKSVVVFDRNFDLSEVYVPLANKLIEVYFRRSE